MALGEHLSDRLVIAMAFLMPWIDPQHVALIAAAGNIVLWHRLIISAIGSTRSCYGLRVEMAVDGVGS